MNDMKVDLMEVYKAFPSVDFQPFTSETEVSRSYHLVRKRKIRYSKGAPEKIISNCGLALINGKTHKLTVKLKKGILKAVEDFSEDALRVLAFSYRSGDKGKDIFIGLVGLYNKPKKGMADVIRSVYDANIDLKMITGDDERTAVSMAKEIGFKNIKAINWERLHVLSQEESDKAMLECNVFARMTPESKLKIVTALQDLGRRVAITGDGVNDVPALKKADGGIAMGHDGADIAKDASDLVILDDHLQTIIDGIIQGRTVFANIRKVIKYLLTSNLAEVFVIFTCALLFKGLLPYLAIHVLWVNLVTNLAPAMAFGVDPPVEHIARRKPTGKNERIINRRMISLTFFVGLKKTLLMLGLFVVSLEITKDLVVAQTLSFTWLVLSHFVHVVAIRFDERTDVFINKVLNWSVALPILFQLVILYTPLGRSFHVVPLTLLQWIMLMIAFVTSLMMTKIITYIINRHYVEYD